MALAVALGLWALSRYPVPSWALRSLLEREVGEIEGLELQVGDVLLYLLPPRVEVRDLLLRSPGTSFAAKRIKVLPKLLPLLRREVALRGLEVEDFQLEVVPSGGGGIGLPPVDHLTLKRGEVTIPIGQGTVEFSLTHGEISLEEGKGTLALEGLRPKGRVVLSFRRGEDGFVIEGKGGGISLAEVRAVASGLGEGDFLDGIVAGEVPAFRFRYGPFGLGDPFDLGRLYLEGDFQGLDLELPQGARVSGAHGRFELSGGSLTVRDGGGRLGGTVLEGGILRLPLSGGRITFSARVRTTPEDLILYLPLFLDGRAKGPLEAFRGSRGQVEGILEVGEKVSAVVEALRLTLVHEDLPFPVEMEGRGRVDPTGLKLTLDRVMAEPGELRVVVLQIPFGGGEGGLSAEGGRVDLSALKGLLSLPHDAAGTMVIKALEASFTLGPLRVQELSLAGVPDLSLRLDPFGPLRVSGGEVVYRGGEVGLRGVRVSARGISGVLSGRIDLRGKGGELRGELRVDEGVPEEVWRLVPIPAPLRPKPPFTFRGGGRASGGGWEVEGVLSFGGGVEAEVEAEGGSRGVRIRKLEIRGGGKGARIALSHPPLALAFRGEVARGTMERIWGVGGSLRGDFSLDGEERDLSGWLEAEDVPLDALSPLPLRISEVRLEGKGEGLRLSGAGSFLGCPIKGEGTGRWEEGVVLDLTVSGGDLDVGALSSLEAGKGGGVKGRIAFGLRSARYGKFVIGNPRGVVELGRGVRVRVQEGSLCGIDLEGTLSLRGKERELRARFSAAEAPLGETLRCLGVKEGLADGTFLLEATFEAEGAGDLLGEGSRGTLYLYSGGGRIYRLTALSRLFSILNVTEVFRGKFPDFTGKGFAYERLEVVGTMADGILRITEGVVEGPSMKIFVEGDVALPSGYLDLRVLVAPLRTVDALLSKIPLLGYVLTGKSKTFISIPFRVRGDYRDPEVIPIPPSEVGKGLLGIVERTLRLPFTIINPLLP